MLQVQPLKGEGKGVPQRLVLRRELGKYGVPGRYLLIPVALLIIVIMVLALNQPAQRPSTPVAPLPPSCSGDLTVRLHNGHPLSSVSYGFYVQNLSSRVEFGSLAPGQNQDFWFRSIPCGADYRLGVSWNGGQWQYQIAQVEQGKTSPVYISAP